MWRLIQASLSNRSIFAPALFKVFLLLKDQMAWGKRSKNNLLRFHIRWNAWIARGVDRLLVNGITKCTLVSHFIFSQRISTRFWATFQILSIICVCHLNRELFVTTRPLPVSIHVVLDEYDCQNSPVVWLFSPVVWVLGLVSFSSGILLLLSPAPDAVDLNRTMTASCSLFCRLPRIDLACDLGKSLSMLFAWSAFLVFYTLWRFLSVTSSVSWYFKKSAFYRLHTTRTKRCQHTRTPIQAHFGNRAHPAPAGLISGMGGFLPRAQEFSLNYLRLLCKNLTRTDRDSSGKDEITHQRIIGDTIHQRTINSSRNPPVSSNMDPAKVNSTFENQG